MSTFASYGSNTQAARPKVSIWSQDQRVGRVDLDEEVTFMEYTKPADGPCGVFTIKVVPRHGGLRDQGGRAVDLAWYRRVLQPNDMVSLGYLVEGGWTIGLIDNISITRQQVTQNGQGQATVEVTITGKDLGKTFVADNIILSAVNTPSMARFAGAIRSTLGEDHPLVSWIYGINGPETEESRTAEQSYTFLGATPKQAADFIVKFAPSLRIPILGSVFGSVGSRTVVGEIGDWLDTSTYVTGWNEGRIWNSSLNEYQGNLWGFLSKLIDPDLYELRIDCSPDLSNPWRVPRVPRPVLILRPKPFEDGVLARIDTKPWLGPPLTRENHRTLVEGLAAHEITDAEIRSSNLAHTDARAWSFYQVQSQHVLAGDANSAAEGVAFPLVDTYSARRWGLKPYQPSLNIVGGDVLTKDQGGQDIDGELYTEVHDARNRLFNWHWASPIMLYGSVQVDGHDFYRAGDPVFLPDEIPVVPTDQPHHFQRGVSFYSTSVRHHWQLGQPYTTTIGVDRGYNAGAILAAKERIVKSAPASNPSHIASA